jgi:hypothetical protein
MFKHPKNIPVIKANKRVNFCAGVFRESSADEQRIGINFEE